MKLFIAILVFSVIFLITEQLLRPRLVARYTLRQLSYCEDGDTLSSRLLYAIMPKSHVFTDLSLPIPSKEGEEINIGVLAVNRSGVYIICQIHGEGIIENPNEQKWKHISNGTCSEFENPFRVQEGARNLIEYYAKNSGLASVKAHSILIYTNPSLRFTNTLSRSVMSAESLNKKLSLMDKRGRLTNSEVRQTCRLLSDIGSGAYP